MWLRHEKHFRNAAFPEFYGSDVVSLPINWNPTNDRHYPTFLVTEFEGIVDPDQFREKFAVNMSDVLQRHEAERFVIQTVGIKHLRGNWFKPKSVVTCTRFPSSEAALRFFHDPEYERLRRSVRDISKNRTTVMFTLTERPVWAPPPAINRCQSNLQTICDKNWILATRCRTSGSVLLRDRQPLS